MWPGEGRGGGGAGGAESKDSMRASKRVAQVYFLQGPGLGPEGCKQDCRVEDFIFGLS